MTVLPVVLLVSLLTFLHYVAAQMRGPILPLYAAAHGATATGVGFIIGAHMMVAAAGSIPLGRASDLWGRRPFLLGGMAVGVFTSLLLPLVDGELALMMTYGLAGLGVAAFTPSALSLVGDAAPPGRAGHAFAWYTTAHYGAIGIGPFLGGLVAQWWGYRAAFVWSALGITIALLIGLAMPMRVAAHASPRSGATFADIRGNASVWAGWIVALGGLLTQGAVSGTAGVAIGVGLAASTTPAARGLVMGGYSTSLYLGLALGSFGLGPVITHQGYAMGFAAGAAAGAIGALVAAFLWATGGPL